MVKKGTQSSLNTLSRNATEDLSGVLLITQIKRVVKVVLEARPWPANTI